MLEVSGLRGAGIAQRVTSAFIVVFVVVVSGEGGGRHVFDMSCDVTHSVSLVATSEVCVWAVQNSGP